MPDLSAVSHTNSAPHPLADPKNADKELPEDDETLKWSWEREHADRRREADADTRLVATEMHSGSGPFQVDRKLLKDIVREHMQHEVASITFLSAGTFHKAYLVKLVNRIEVVARVARRFMPRLKTESEVATMHYLRERTHVPVPTIFHYDSNPYNRLGGEFIIMSKAPGTPLSKVYHTLSYNQLVALLTNLAGLVIPLFEHRFTHLGSLYFGPSPVLADGSSSGPTPKPLHQPYQAFPFSPTLGMFHPKLSSLSEENTPRPPNSRASSTRGGAGLAATMPLIAELKDAEHHVGPIVSWPFFGSNRGDLAHPAEINRGPWRTTSAYLKSCADREIQSVVRESEGKAAPHRLHLDPAEIRASRHHHLRAIPGDESDDSDEWDMEESEEEYEGPGDAMYRDYRRMQRGTFLVAHVKQREEKVREEMGRFVGLMERLRGVLAEREGSGDKEGEEEFGLDCHDLSLENVFVDERDPTRITCIIDWESTTTRPLWACAHLPAFLQSSPFTAKLFRQIVTQMAEPPASASSMSTAIPSSTSTPSGSGTNNNKAKNPLIQSLKLDMTSIPAPPSSSNNTEVKSSNMPALARAWLHYERYGMRLRMAHRFVEWDGWEEDLVESMLGAEEHEEDWFVDFDYDQRSVDGEDGEESAPHSAFLSKSGTRRGSAGAGARGMGLFPLSPLTSVNGHAHANGNGKKEKENREVLDASISRKSSSLSDPKTGTGAGKGKEVKRKPASTMPFVRGGEKEKEQLLDGTGDVCGGRGGELGRRLEAWLSVSNGERGENGEE